MEQQAQLFSHVEHPHRHRFDPHILALVPSGESESCQAAGVPVGKFNLPAM